LPKDLDDLLIWFAFLPVVCRNSRNSVKETTTVI